MIKFEDAIKITEFMTDNGYDMDDITIDIKVPNKEILDKLNEDYFLRTGHRTENEKIQFTDIVTIHINGVTFRYSVSENAEDKQ